MNPRWDEFFFTAGILHDLGRLVLAQVDAEYPKVCLWATDVWSYVASNPGTIDPKAGEELLQTKVFPVVKLKEDQIARIRESVEQEKHSLTYE